MSRSTISCCGLIALVLVGLSMFPISARPVMAAGLLSLTQTAEPTPPTTTVPPTSTTIPPTSTSIPPTATSTPRPEREHHHQSEPTPTPTEVVVASTGIITAPIEATMVPTEAAVSPTEAGATPARRPAAVRVQRPQQLPSTGEANGMQSLAPLTLLGLSMLLLSLALHACRRPL